MDSPSPELELLAVFVHGALAGLHGLALFYHVKRGNKLDASIHAAILAYDGLSAWKHYEDSKRHFKDRT